MKKLFLFPILMLVLSMMGCSTLTQSDSAGLVVQYATIKFINADASPVARAQRVAAIAREAKTFFDDDTLPLEQIEQLIRQKIKWSELDVADTLLVNALINRVEEEVATTSGIPEAKRVSGSTVLGWIIQGARLAGG